MASGGLLRGAHILRSAPWPALLGTVSTAAVLLVIGTLTHRSALGPVAILLGLSACGGAAAFVLDEETGTVLDATPTSRERRVAWRLLIVALPVAVALTGLSTLNLIDAPTHWLRLVPFAVGAVAIGVGLAAALRRGGLATPGDLASVLALAGTVLLVTVDPLRRWVTVAPLGDAAHPGRSSLLWIAVVAACGAITLACTRDPGRLVRARRRPEQFGLTRGPVASATSDPAREGTTR